MRYAAVLCCGCAALLPAATPARCAHAPWRRARRCDQISACDFLFPCDSSSEQLMERFGLLSGFAQAMRSGDPGPHVLRRALHALAEAGQTNERWAHTQKKPVCCSCSPADVRLAGQADFGVRQLGAGRARGCGGAHARNCVPDGDGSRAALPPIAVTSCARWSWGPRWMC